MPSFSRSTALARQAQRGCDARPRPPRLRREANLVGHRVPQAGGRVERDQPAAIDDRHAVGELLGFVHEVRRQQHGGAALAQRADDVPGARRAWGSMAAVGSSRNTRLRPADQRQAQAEPLLLAARELSEARAGDLAQLELVEQRVGVFGVRDRTPRTAAAPRAAVICGNSPPCCSISPMRGLSAAPWRAGSRPSTRTEPPSGAPVALQDLDGRRLARAVGPEQRENFAGLDRERQPVDDGAAVVAS